MKCFVGSVVLVSLRAAQNIPYMVAIGVVFVESGHERLVVKSFFLFSFLMYVVVDRFAGLLWCRS